MAGKDHDTMRDVLNRLILKPLAQLEPWCHSRGSFCAARVGPGRPALPRVVCSSAMTQCYRRSKYMVRSRSSKRRPFLAVVGLVFEMLGCFS